MKDTPVSALKIIKGGGCVLRAAVLWLCFKLPFCLFDHTWDTPVIYDKAKCVCFIYM